MSEIPRENLESFARKVRQDVQPFYSPETICPGYTFDEDNLAFGQCGLTSVYAAKRFMYLARAADLTMLLKQGDGNINLGIGRSFNVPLIFQQMLLDDEKFQSQIDGMAGTIPMCEYGKVFYEDELLSDDHCWLRVVQLADSLNPKKGQVVETTLDQFSRKDLPLPAVLTQPADNQEGPIRYVAEPGSQVVGRHRTDQNKFEERYRILTEKVNEVLADGEALDLEIMPAASEVYLNPRMNKWRI